MRSRGSSLVAVLAVLTLLSAVMAVMVRLLATDLAETRRRSNAHYASELAHSGIDWALACVASRGGLSDTTLKVDRGEIDIKVEIGDGGTKIRSRGKVVLDEKVLEQREEVLEIGTRVDSSGSLPVAPVAPPSVLRPEDPPEIGRPRPLFR